MTISLLFSAVVYRGVSLEIERGVRRQAVRMIPLNDLLPDDFHEQIISEAKQRIVFELLILNLIILLTSGAAGYFLAGKTLKPIAQMVEEQKHFVADASHEIRTPLTALKTEIEVAMRDKKLSLEEAKEILQSNLEEIDKLKMLSDYLLSANKYQNNADQISYEVVDLGGIVKETLVSLKSLFNDKKLEIVSDLGNVKIRANRASLIELTIILLDNAIKYSRNEGKITVKVWKQKFNAFMIIEDTGVGIKSKDLPYIFDRFFRAETSRSKDKLHGFGLGLSIAKNIAEVNRAKISVKSVFEKGSQFTIIFPLHS
jgi:two-component system, OmpR family, sensor histidine kinase CiaH